MDTCAIRRFFLKQTKPTTQSIGLRGGFTNPVLVPVLCARFSCVWQRFLRLSLTKKSMELLHLFQLPMTSAARPPNK